MMNEAKRAMIKDALAWSGDIGCCSDKERYALRVVDLLDALGIRDVPADVEGALRELMAWEDCAGPCETVNAFLRNLAKAGCE